MEEPPAIRRRITMRPMTPKPTPYRPTTPPNPSPTTLSLLDSPSSILTSPPSSPPSSLTPMYTPPTTQPPIATPQLTNRLFTAILNHNLHNHTLLVQWTGRKQPTWEPLTPSNSFLQHTSSFALVLTYLNTAYPLLHRHAEVTLLTQWITTVEQLKFVYELHESTQTPTHYAFCCDHCNCPDDQQLDCQSSCSNSGNESLWHRWCCHHISQVANEQDWISPIQKIIEESIQQSPCTPLNTYCHSKELPAMAKSSLVAEQTAVTYFDGRAAEDNIAYTCPNYAHHVKQYHTEPQRAPAVVLDVFAGIGSGMVALKKLQIAMSTVIHIDMDPIATHVSQYHHDSNYNTKLTNDGITHIYHDYHWFEDLQSDVDTFLQTYGPIDIILGGPPCTDYCAINATRQGIHGTSGNLLVSFGNFIHTLQTHPLQHSKHVYFLAENVVLQEFDDIQVLSEAYSVPYTIIDAKEFSPCKRKRVYWISFPMDPVENDITNIARNSSAKLDDGWFMPSQVSSGKTAKVNTFLSSKGRLEDRPRMSKVTEVEPDRYQIGTFSVNERERMMGLPEKYVQEAVQALYETLTTTAFMAEFEANSHWKDTLDGKYHHFRECEYTFVTKTEPPFFEIQIRPPVSEGKTKLGWHCWESYCKRLIGNGWSIPVVEFLLRPLVEKFPSRKYDGYDYTFGWEPYT